MFHSLTRKARKYRRMAGTAMERISSVGSKNRYASWVGKKNPDAVKIKPAARATRIPRPSP